MTIDSAAALVAGEDLQPAALWPAMWTQRNDIELDGWAAATSGTDGLFACSLLKLYLLVKYAHLTPGELSSTRALPLEIAQRELEPFMAFERQSFLYL